MAALGPSTATGAWRLRTSLILLLVVATLVTYGVIGISVIAYRVPAILKEEQQHAQSEAVVLARYFEQLLNSLEGRVAALMAIDAGMPPAQVQRLMDGVTGEGGFAAIYLADRRGRIEYVAVSEAYAEGRKSLLGADLIRNPLFNSALQLDRRVWSDRYFSPLTGEATIGLAIPFGKQVLVGEVAPDFAAAMLMTATEDNSGPVLLVDRAGELVAGKHIAESDRLRNWAGELKATLAGGRTRLHEIRLDGKYYDIGLAQSEKLQWTFMMGTPAGLDNPRVRLTIGLVVAGLLGSMLLGLVLAPLWATWMSGVVRDLIAQTRALTSGKFGGKVARGPIQEFNQLAADMESMAESVRQRQLELERSEERLLQSLQNVQQLNLLLEHRVELRTLDLARANRELSEAMEALKQAQGDLVQSEKLASLGNLVGGVAHELNTPIGNALMAVTTMEDHVRNFSKRLQVSLQRAELNNFVANVEQGSAIAVRNLQRANELIASFKQVAVDQTSVQRRRFELAEVVDEILMTLQPSLKRSSHRVECRVAPRLGMDSYPGPLGQVLTNLVNNALIHAFEGRSGGVISIVAEAEGENDIVLQISDNGVGIPPTLIDRVFEPFVTTKLGYGGSGLGLHIVWNTVNGILGGNITVSSTSGEGTCFRIVMPCVAPTVAAPG